MMCYYFIFSDTSNKLHMQDRSREEGAPLKKTPSVYLILTRRMELESIIFPSTSDIQ